MGAGPQTPGHLSAVLFAFPPWHAPHAPALPGPACTTHLPPATRAPGAPWAQPQRCLASAACALQSPQRAQPVLGYTRLLPRAPAQAAHSGAAFMPATLRASLRRAASGGPRQAYGQGLRGGTAKPGCSMGLTAVAYHGAPSCTSGPCLEPTCVRTHTGTHVDAHAHKYMDTHTRVVSPRLLPSSLSQTPPGSWPEVTAVSRLRAGDRPHHAMCHAGSVMSQSPSSPRGPSRDALALGKPRPTSTSSRLLTGGPGGPGWPASPFGPVGPWGKEKRTPCDH